MSAQHRPRNCCKKTGACTSKRQADQNKATNKSNVDLTLLPGLNHYSSLLSIMDSDQGPGTGKASEGRRSWGDRGPGLLKLRCCKNDALISNCERQLSRSTWIGFLLFKRKASPRSRRFGQFKCIDPRRGEKCVLKLLTLLLWFFFTAFLQGLWHLLQNWVFAFDAVIVIYYVG